MKNNYKRILIKIGTSTVTTEGTLNLAFIKRICQEISDLQDSGHEIIMISSGAVGAGMEISKINKRPKEQLQLQILSGKGQVRLMSAYQDSLLHHGIQSAQVLLTHHNFSNDLEINNIRRVLVGCIKEKTIPIINENDIVSTEELSGYATQSFSDNDELAALVAAAISVDLLLILTDVDGLCTSDPRLDACSRLIPRVDKVTDDIRRIAKKEGSIMGLGGMLSKVNAADKAISSNSSAIISNGKYAIEDILKGKVPRTLFCP